MKEHRLTLSYPTEEPRKWFSDDYFDLIVWYGSTGQITSFQLCYDVAEDQRAISWDVVKGFSHSRIDEGEDNPEQNRSPILIPDTEKIDHTVIEKFTEHSKSLESKTTCFVLEKLGSL